MSKSKIFICLCVSFLVGVLIASLSKISDQIIYISLAAGISLTAVFYFFRQKFLGFIFFSILFICFGALRLNNGIKENQFTKIFNQKTQIEGYITEEADVRSDKQLLTFLPDHYEQNILITASLAQEFFYGDRVVVEGKFTEAKSFDDFDYKGYLEAKNIYALSYQPKILILKSHGLNFFKEKVLKIKAAFVKRVNSLIAEPESSLLLGILIGAKKTLPENITNEFNKAGLSHIIAVSGYNISVIVGCLGYLSYLIGRKKNFWLTLLFIGAFTILTGASASVIRAGLMGFLVLLSQRSGRMYHITSSLCLAAGIMVLQNPRILVWDAGFQLSFLATLGIVYGMPVLEKLTLWWTEVKFLKTILLTTLSAIIATLPLLLFEFGQLSIIAVVANLLVLPLVPPVMFVGFLCITPFFGPGFAFITSVILKAIIGLVKFLTVWKYSALEFKISPLTFVLLYGFILLLYFWLKDCAKKVEGKREV